MDSAHCPRCFHLIGEHLYCADRGGVFESAKVDKTQHKPLDPCPPDAIYDFNHVWWNFLV